MSSMATSNWNRKFQGRKRCELSHRKSRISNAKAGTAVILLRCALLGLLSAGVLQTFNLDI